MTTTTQASASPCSSARELSATARRSAAQSAALLFAVQEHRLSSVAEADAALRATGVSFIDIAGILDVSPLALLRARRWRRRGVILTARPTRIALAELSSSMDPIMPRESRD